MTGSTITPAPSCPQHHIRPGGSPRGYSPGPHCLRQPGPAPGTKARLGAWAIGSCATGPGGEADGPGGNCSRCTWHILRDRMETGQLSSTRRCGSGDLPVKPRSHKRLPSQDLSAVAPAAEPHSKLLLGHWKGYPHGWSTGISVRKHVTGRPPSDGGNTLNAAVPPAQRAELCTDHRLNTQGRRDEGVPQQKRQTKLTPPLP